ncbi:hypothetical protein, partial [Neisseria gonorrhoeae]|uniref:hypothetical protein n=1 Tax=Neisseria gonorrhoeae TaxID=485 RepID=UPI0016499CF8
LGLRDAVVAMATGADFGFRLAGGIVRRLGKRGQRDRRREQHSEGHNAHCRFLRRSLPGAVLELVEDAPAIHQV